MMMPGTIIDPADRISQLPVDLIHRILRPLDVRVAVQTSVLSRTWRRIWISRPFLEFDQSWFFPSRRSTLSDEEREICMEKFKNYVDDSLKALIAQNLNVDKFVLKVPHYRDMPESESDIDRCMDRSDIDRYMDQWLGLAVRADVKVLKIEASYVKLIGLMCSCYQIPGAVLSARSLTTLFISTCKLGISPESVMNLPVLRKLYLELVQDLDDYQIHCLIQHCPLIEDVRMARCDGMEILSIFGLPNLTSVEVMICEGLKRIQIQAPKLTTFKFYDDGATTCEIIMDGCVNLRFLTLETSCATVEIVQALLSKFPLLESLRLGGCHLLRSIKVVSPQLRRLTIDSCKDLQHFEIEAPNLVSLTYLGDKMPFSSMDPSSLRQAAMIFTPPNVPNTKLDIDLDIMSSFLRKLSHSTYCLLMVRYNKNVLIYEDFEEVHLPEVQDLRLVITTSCRFLGQLLRSHKPKSISILPNSKSRMLHKEEALRSGGEAEEDYSKYLKQKFNLYDVKEIVETDKCVVFEDKFETSTWFAWLSSVALLKQTISFLCEWS